MKKHYLLVLVCLLSFYSCNKSVSVIITRFYINNNSTHNIEMFVSGFQHPEFYFNIDTTFFISIGEEINYSYEYDWDYESPFGYGSDSLAISFNDTLTVGYTRDDIDPRNPLLLDNYTGGKISDDLYEYYYTITEEDYENALANY